MSRGGATRFQKGQSGNPAGRPRQRRPHISAFDIIFDRKLTITQNGVERELTVDEALEFQTYQAALKGRKMAVRQVLKMIAKREAALAMRNPGIGRAEITRECEYNSDNANEAMRLLGIIEHDPQYDDEMIWVRVANWATQAALSRPGRRKFDDSTVKDIRFFTIDGAKLRWPRGQGV